MKPEITWMRGIRTPVARPTAAPPRMGGARSFAGKRSGSLTFSSRGAPGAPEAPRGGPAAGFGPAAGVSTFLPPPKLVDQKRILRYSDSFRADPTVWRRVAQSSLGIAIHARRTSSDFGRPNIRFGSTKVYVCGRSSIYGSTLASERAGPRQTGRLRAREWGLGFLPPSQRGIRKRFSPLGTRVSRKSYDKRRLSNLS